MAVPFCKVREMIEGWEGLPFTAGNVSRIRGYHRRTVARLCSSNRSVPSLKFFLGRNVYAGKEDCHGRIMVRQNGERNAEDGGADVARTRGNADRAASRKGRQERTADHVRQQRR